MEQSGQHAQRARLERLGRREPGQEPELPQVDAEHRSAVIGHEPGDAQHRAIAAEHDREGRRSAPSSASGTISTPAGAI